MNTERSDVNLLLITDYDYESKIVLKSLIEKVGFNCLNDHTSKPNNKKTN